MVINTVEFWINAGALCARPTRPDGRPIPDRKLLHEHGLVKLEAGADGTTVSWVMFTANWSSLMFLSEFVMTCLGPVTLRYFNAGWFEETIETTVDARSRIEQLLVKSDVRLAERTYVSDFDPKAQALPPKLREALEGQGDIEKTAITCAVDPDTETVNVESIGADSLLGKIWGLSPVSFPCQTGHNYDRIVSRPYFKVINSGRPHYDHVLAAMVRPDGEVGWIGYQRIIMPDLHPTTGAKRVRIVSELSPVDIRLL
ncbi:MAG: hypothetical protein U1E15_02630 [Hyphomicrobiales bacterium]